MMTWIQRWLFALLACVAFAGCGNESRPAPNGAPANSKELAPPDDLLLPVREFAERFREARQKAIEMGQPTGLKFVAPDGAPLLADKYLTVRQPEGFSMGWVEGAAGASFVVGYAGAGKIRFPDVEPGDLLELTQEHGKVYRIVGVKAERLDLAEVLAASIKASPKEPNYAIHRQPRPIEGAKPVSLPSGWAIDLTPPPPNGMGLTGLGLDAILFAPDGSALTPDPESAVIWIRQAKDEGHEAIILVRSRTGSITVHPVNRDPNVGKGDPLHHALPKTANDSMP